jgi:hypothetical protein
MSHLKRHERSQLSTSLAGEVMHMVVYLTAGAAVCAIVLILVGIYILVTNKVNPRLIGLGFIVIVCDVCLIYAMLFLSIHKLHRVLGID